MAILNHMSDIPYFKKTTDVDPYIEAFDIDNNNIDFDVLDDYKESDYVYNADNLDELSDSINIMQNNWSDDVIGNLSDKYNLYQLWIDNFKTTKNWVGGTTRQYYKNEIVTNWTHSIYICLQDCTGAEPLPEISDYPHYGTMTTTPLSMGIIGIMGVEEGLNSCSYSYKLDIYYKYKTTDGVEEHYLKFNNVKDLELFPDEGNIEDWDSTRRCIYTSYDYNRSIFFNLAIAFVEGDVWTEKSLVCLTTGYNDSDEVGNYYIDIQNNTTDYWICFVNKGGTGENSCDLQWRGEWNIENTYSVKDVVWHSTSPTSTSFFVCIKTASGQQILNTEYWVSFYTIWTDTLDTYDNMPNQSWFDTKSNPTIFGVRDDDEISDYEVVQFVNRVESESALNPAYVDMGSDISSLLVYYNNDDESYQSLIDVWNSFIKNNNLYSNVRR